MVDLKVCKIRNGSGFTLVELLITVAILGIIMVGLHQVLWTAISAYESTKEKQDLLAQARYAMDRMAMFVQETDEINIPFPDKIKVSERLLDTYDNSDQTYMPGGDGYLDADNDYDGLVNEGGADDPKEYIIFRLDVISQSKLEENMPDYSTTATDDLRGWQVICEYVSGVTFTSLATNLVEIELSLNDGNSQVTLKTRVKAMYVE